MDEKKNTKIKIGVGRLYISPRYKRPTEKDAKKLFTELQALKPVTRDGLPVIIKIEAGVVSVCVEGSQAETDLFLAQQEARRKAESLKADAVAVAKAALREAKARDYSDDEMRRSFGISRVK